jgi:hypothetical protein
MTKAEMDGVVEALRLMMRLREQVPYLGRGYRLLNSACHRLTARFWRDEGHPAMIRHRRRNTTVVLGRGKG